MADNMALSQTPSLADFYDFLYEDTVGYVYSATKSPNSGAWERYFFEWPAERQALIAHTEEYADEFEVYAAPSLFGRPEATKDAWLGSHVYWAEFDYGTPEATVLARLSVPNPGFRIRSSSGSHEHWYWKSECFQDSAEDFEQVSRRIAYGLEADLGTWNRNRVLRPPHTVHHDSGRRVVILAVSDTRVTALDFGKLREAPTGITIDPEQDLPEVMECIARYQWTGNAFDTFRSNTVPVGERSDRLCWLAYECAAMGMANAEILSVLLNVDSRWKKFAGRDDRVDQLLAIIGRARLKFPLNSALSDGELPVIGSADFVAKKIDFEWVIEGLLPKKSLWLLVSPPAVGKTQLTLQTAIHMALGREFLKFPITKPIKTIFFSLEMPEDNLQYFMEKMYAGFSEEELAILNENLLVVPLGYSLRFDNPVEQQRLLDIIDKWRPDGILIDSLGTSISNIDNNEAVLSLLDFYKRKIIAKYGIFVGLIHHFRKGQVGNKKPNSLYDLFGSQYIGSTADLVLSLWKNNPLNRNEPIAVNALKPRMGVGFDEFYIHRTEQLSFELANEKTPTGALIGSGSVASQISF